jgi:hypothetical protein
MKLLHAVPASNGSMTFYVPKGQYGFFQIVFDLDAAAGVTITRAQLGNIKFNWQGSDVFNVDAELLSLLGNVYGGISEFTAVAGGATRCSIFIPCGAYWDSQNIYDIHDNDRVYFELTFPLLTAAVIDSGFVKVYGKNKVGVMNYLFNIMPRPVVSSGAAVLSDTYEINNVISIYMKNPAALVSDIQIDKNNQTIYNAPTTEIQAYSDWIHQLETTNTTLALEFAESKDIREALGSTVRYQMTFTGAGTLAQYFAFVEFTPEKANASALRARRALGVVTTPSTTPTGGNRAALKVKEQRVLNAVD